MFSCPPRGSERDENSILIEAIKVNFFHRTVLNKVMKVVISQAKDESTDEESSLTKGGGKKK